MQYSVSFLYSCNHLAEDVRAGSCADPEGGDRGPGPPLLENNKNIGLLSNTGPDPLKITKLPI